MTLNDAYGPKSFENEQTKLVSQNESSEIKIQHEHFDHMLEYDDDDDDAKSEHKIPIPDVDGFSFRKLWLFTGPGLMMATAYIDPGTIQSGLQSGAETEYDLLWVWFLATLVGFFMQRLAIRLGVVTGLNLAKICYKEYRPIPRFLLWAMVQIGIIAADMQEVIGTAVALKLLINQFVPGFDHILWIGTLVTFLEVIPCLELLPLRSIELLFGVLIAIKGIAFGYEYIQSEPKQMEILEHLFVPGCKDCEEKEILQAVGIIGALISPHNLYVHSALVKSRVINRGKSTKIREANMYYFIETAVALTISLLINVFVVSIFASGLFGKTRSDFTVDGCKDERPKVVYYSDDFKTKTVENANLYEAGIFLGCHIGEFSLYIWFLGILISGQTAMIIGTHASKYAIEGFLNTHLAHWKRVLITRSVVIIPVTIVAGFYDIGPLTSMNVILNVVKSFQLPFAIIPAIAFTSSVGIMGKFVNGIFIRTTAILLFITIFCVNIVFLVLKLKDAEWTWTFLPLIVFGISYVTFVAYLLVHMSVFMGNKRLAEYSVVQKYVLPVKEEK